MLPEPAQGQYSPQSPAGVLKERVRSVFLQLPKALAGDTNAIHQMRVTGRRLRVALLLLARKPRGRRVKRALTALRDLTRIAGGSRDLDVSAELLAEHLVEAGTSRTELATLRRHLRQARGRSRARMVEGLLDQEIARLRRDLRAILERGSDDIFTVAGRLGRLRDAKGEALSREFLALQDRFDPEALHRLRIRVRRLRYTAELGHALRGLPLEAAALLKRLQESLGGIHDRYVLAAWLGRQAASADRRGQSTLADAARTAQAAELESSRAHHRSFLESDPTSMLREALMAMGQKDPAPGPAVPPAADAAPRRQRVAGGQREPKG